MYLSIYYGMHSSEYYTPVRECTAAPMFVSCSTADRSRWCAQLADSQYHRYIEVG